MCYAVKLERRGANVGDAGKPGRDIEQYLTLPTPAGPPGEPREMRAMLEMKPAVEPLHGETGKQVRLLP